MPSKDELLEIPWKNPTREQERDYYRTVLTNPLILGYIVLFALFCAAIVFWSWKPGKYAPPEQCGNACRPERREGSVSRAVGTAIHDGAGLLLALAAGLAIFVPLYTTLFQNMNGLRTSTVATDGTLLYWLAQHDVQRGEQPWFYFLLMLPQYEFLVVSSGWIHVGGGRYPGYSLHSSAGSPGRNLFFRLFIAVWFVLIFAGLSYGGEKMPWLVVHIALPGILLAAAFTGAAIERG